MRRDRFTCLPRGFVSHGDSWFLRAPRARPADPAALKPLLSLCSYGSRLAVAPRSDGWYIEGSRLSSEERGQFQLVLQALVKKEEECRWAENTSTIPTNELAPHRQRILRSTGLSLESLIDGDRLNLRRLRAGGGLLLLVLDRAVTWPDSVTPPSSVQNGTLEQALAEARDALLQLRPVQISRAAAVSASSINGWLALEAGDRIRARTIAETLANQDEARPLRIALAWLERDEAAVVEVLRQAAAANSLASGRFDGAYGEVACWDGFIRLAIADAGALLPDAAWLVGCQFRLGDVDLEDREREMLRRGACPGNPAPIVAACRLLVLWDALLALREAVLTDAPIPAEDLPDAAEVDAALLPHPFRQALGTLSEAHRRLGEVAAAEEIPVGPAAVFGGDEAPYSRALRRGELEVLSAALPEAPEQALHRGQEVMERFGPRWTPEEHHRAASGLFLLACRARAWELAATWLPQAAALWPQLPAARDWEDGAWLFVEQLPWEDPDRGAGFGATGDSFGLRCLALWDRLAGDPSLEAPAVIAELGQLGGPGLIVNAVRQRLSRWWLRRLSPTDLEQGPRLWATVTAHQLVGDETEPGGQLEARVLANAALEFDREPATNLAEDWLTRWQRRLEVAAPGSGVAHEWRRFSEGFRGLWDEGLFDERPFWAWAECCLLDFDHLKQQRALEELSEALASSLPRLGLASRLLDIFDRLADRVESASSLGPLCRAVLDWLEGQSPTPAAVPFQAALTDAVARSAGATGMDIPDLAHLAARFSTADHRATRVYLPPGEMLRNVVIALVGGRASTVARVAQFLRSEDGVADVVHIAAGQAKGPRGDLVVSADWVVLLTTYLGHDDSEAVERALRRRGQLSRLVRLPDRRDGSHSIVQLLRRTAAARATLR